MNKEATRDIALQSTHQLCPPRRIPGAGRLNRTAKRVGPAVALTFLMCTTITGLMLYGSGAHGGALSTVHMLCAFGLTISVVGHLIDRRRQLLGLVRRRHGKALRTLLVDAALLGLLLVSMVTGLGFNESGPAMLHVLISLALLAAYAAHAYRRIARRLRTAERAWRSRGGKHRGIGGSAPSSVDNVYSIRRTD